MSTIERFRSQRERVIRAVAQAELEGSATVRRVAELAGIGRSTFYECFDDYEHALHAVHGVAAARLAAACAAPEGEAPIPALAAAWCNGVAAEPELLLIAVRLDAVADSDSIGEVFCSALRDRAATDEALGDLSALVAPCAAWCARSLALAIRANDPAGSGELVNAAATSLSRAVAAHRGAHGCG